MPTANAGAPRPARVEAQRHQAQHSSVDFTAHRDTIQSVLDRLEGVHKAGAGWSAKCPAHNDRHASLSVSDGDAGKVLLFCHAGCEYRDVAAAIGVGTSDAGHRGVIGSPKLARPKPANDAGELVAGIAADAPPPPAAHFKHGRPSATWTYRDAEGPLYHTYRFDHPDGSKDVLPVTLWRNKAGALNWEFKGYPAPRPLYGLDRLAARPADPVAITEGEKDADGAAVLLTGWVAITSPGGSKAADKTDWRQMEGKDAVIWADADEPGEKYAADVERLAIEAGARCVGRLDLAALAALRGAPLPKGYGAADALAEGIDRDALAALMFEALARAEAKAQAQADTDAPQGESIAEIAARTRAAKAKADKLPRFEIIEGSRDQRPGLYYFGSTRDKETGEDRPAPPVWLADPLHVTANTRDERGNEWGRMLKWKDRDGRWHCWAMPMEMLAAGGDELRAALLRGGLNITSNPADRRRLLDYITWSRPAITARAVSRTGWHGTAFVLPDRTVGDTEAEPIHYQGTNAEGVKLGAAGTLEGWRDQVAAPCAGNSRLVLYVAAGFAANCLTMLGAEGGGIHLRGPSSSGKTTALLAAASTWGPPDYKRTWRATDNALEGVAAQHSDLPLPLDEIGELPAKVAGATAYMLANGLGKGRAHRDGTARAVSQWRVLFLSTGEIGLADLIAEAGGRTRAGQEVRVIDLPADAGAGFGMFETLPTGMTAGAFADRLRDAAATHYGHAGPAFVAKLVQDYNDARDTLRTARDGIAAKLAPADAAGQVRRVAQRFALVAAAGELATDWGLTGWHAGEAATAATVCFRAWLGARGTTGAAEPAAMLALVRRFLEAHGDSRFATMDQSDTRPVIERAGFRRETPDGTEYLVLRERFREICTGFDPQAVARALADAGVLAKDTEGGNTKPERLPGLGLTRVYRITPAIWSTGNA